MSQDDRKVLSKRRYGRFAHGYVTSPTHAGGPDVGESGNGLKDQVKAATANLERQLITKALEQTGRNVTKTAQLLKISRKSLQTKMKDLGLRDD